MGIFDDLGKFIKDVADKIEDSIQDIFDTDDDDENNPSDAE